MVHVANPGKPGKEIGADARGDADESAEATERVVQALARGESKTAAAPIDFSKHAVETAGQCLTS